MTDRRTLRQHLDLSLQNLEERRREVVVGRMGLNGDPMPLRELSKRLAVSNERIRQLEETGIAQIRREASWPDDLLSTISKMVDARRGTIQIDDLAVHDWFSGFPFLANALRYMLVSVCDGDFDVLVLEQVQPAVVARTTKTEWPLLQRRARVALAEISGATESECRDRIASLLEGRHELFEPLWAQIQGRALFDGQSAERVRHSSIKDAAVGIVQRSDVPMRYEAVAEKLERLTGKTLSHHSYCSMLSRMTRMGRGIVQFDRGTFGPERLIELRRKQRSEIVAFVESTISQLPSRQWHSAELLDLLPVEMKHPQLTSHLLDHLLQASKKLTCLKRSAWVDARHAELENGRLSQHGALVRALEAAGGPLSRSDLAKAVSLTRGTPTKLMDVVLRHPIVRIGRLFGLAGRDELVPDADLADFVEQVFIRLKRSGCLLDAVAVTRLVEMIPGRERDLSQFMDALRHDGRFQFARDGSLLQKRQSVPRGTTLRQVIREQLKDAPAGLPFQKLLSVSQSVLERDIPSDVMRVGLYAVATKVGNDDVWRLSRPAT